MAVSGSYDFIQTRDKIITGALRVCKVIGQNGTPSAIQITNGAEALEALVKSWRPHTKMVWTIDWTTQTLTAADEVTGTDGEVYTCIRKHTSSTSDTPITGADFSTYWRLRGSTGGTWVDLTDYDSVNENQLAAEIWAIDSAFIRRDNYDTPLVPLTNEQYMDLANKSILGKPNSYYFERKLSQPTLYLYPMPENETDVIHLQAIKIPQDFDAAANNPDFPIDWMNALKYGLANELAPEYVTDRAFRIEIREDAIYHKELVGLGDNEQTDLKIMIDRRR